MTPLLPYQHVGARFLASRTRALLADEPGLGKTAQAIAACDLVGARRVLVFCPASVRENWRREFQRFSTTSPDTTILSYDYASRKGGLPDADALVLDEAHFLKNRKAKRTKAIFDYLAERPEMSVFLLTGTPAPKNPADLWPSLYHVLPEAILTPAGKPMTYWHFVSRYCVVRNNGFGDVIVGGRNLGELRDRLASHVLRRKKEDVLTELPPIRFTDLPLAYLHDLSSGNVADTIARLESGEEGAAIHHALETAGLDALQQLAGRAASLRRELGLLKAGLLACWLKDRLADNEDKIVVFAYHRDVIAMLAQMLKPFGVEKIVGDTPSAERQAAVDRFQTDLRRRVFIGQITAAGTGITLTAASEAVIVEPSWVPAENEQAAMRIHRIGQRDACLVRYAYLAGSLDEKIAAVCLRRSRDTAVLFG